jgi:serine/threonine protein kinase
MDKYDLICVIGNGANSTVYKSYSKLINDFVAVKEINFKNKTPMIEMEINIIKKLECENILKFIDVIYEKKKLYIITDLCEYSLTAVISNIHSEEMILYIFKQLANGFNYLYGNKIIHRDIKPDNILICKYKIKIADFGFAREFINENSLLNTICGTPIYMAPEIIVNNEYGIKSDIWSLGVILYQIIYKKFPYEKVKNINELINIFQNKKPIVYFKTNYSDDLIDLLKSMLQIDPDNRISWIDFFKHKWINKEVKISDFTEINVFDDILLDNLNNSVSISKSMDDSIFFDSNDFKENKKCVQNENTIKNIDDTSDKKLIKDKSPSTNKLLEIKNLESNDSLVVKKKSLKVENKNYIEIESSVIKNTNNQPSSIPKENIIENYFNNFDKDKNKELIESVEIKEELSYFEWSIKIIKKSVGKYFSY